MSRNAVSRRNVGNSRHVFTGRRWANHSARRSESERPLPSSSRPRVVLGTAARSGGVRDPSGRSQSLPAHSAASVAGPIPERWRNVERSIGGRGPEELGKPFALSVGAGPPRPHGRGRADGCVS